MNPRGRLANRTVFDSAMAAEAAFYRAFGAGDVDAMMRVWAHSGDIACIHPGGPRLTGLPAIRASWEHIFTAQLPREIELRDRRVSGDEELRVHLLEEHISVPGTRYVAPAVLATNVYRRIGDAWYMMLHHASLAPVVRAPPPAGAIGSGPAGPLH